MTTKSTPTGPASTRTGKAQAQTTNRGGVRPESPLRGTQPDPSPSPEATEDTARAEAARTPAKATERAVSTRTAERKPAAGTRAKPAPAPAPAPEPDDFPEPIADTMKAEADVDPAKRTPVPDDPADAERTAAAGDDDDDDGPTDLDPAKAPPARHPSPEVEAALGNTVGRYLVAKKAGLKTGHGFVEAGSYVPAEWLGSSIRRMLRTGEIVDLGTGESPEDPPEGPSEDPDEGDETPPVRTGDAAPRSLAATLTEEAGKADLPTLAADSDASGVVAQKVPVVLRFLDAHPHRAGDILSAERKRSEPRVTIVDAAKETAKTYAKDHK